MNKPIRIGVLGLHHDHVWSNLEELKQVPELQLVSAADPYEALRNQLTQQYPEVSVYEDYQAMLSSEQLDAVYIFASNRVGAKLAAEAARQRLHVLIEKPLAADLAGAEAAVAAAQENQTLLMVNWPFCWWPQLQEAIRRARAGEIGRLWQVKYRAAHQGPAELGCSSFFCNWLYDEQLNGGGALMDYCCYGAVLARVLLGMPEAVTGIQGRLCKELPVEDNALLAFEYPRQLATSEASWTQQGKLTAYTTAIYGETGTLLVEPRVGGRLLLATTDEPDGRELAVPAPTPELVSASAHFAWAISKGQTVWPLCESHNCRDVQAMLEAGRRSARLHQQVQLKDLKDD